jgi:hypothetical protein
MRGLPCSLHGHIPPTLPTMLDRFRNKATVAVLSVTAFIWYSLFTIYKLPSSVPSALTRRDTSFPAVYLADGILNCGVQLVPDQCVPLPTSYTFSTNAQQTFFISAPVWYSVDDFYWNTTKYPVVTIPINTTVVMPATYRITLTPTPSYTRIVATNSYAPSITIPPLLPRSYDFNPCEKTPPSHDFVSRSLSDVCHFLANTRDYFVSSRPRESAYLPSWPGYLVQILISILNIFGIVAPRSADLESRI